MKETAESRRDISKWLIHLSRGPEPGTNGDAEEQKDALWSILRGWKVRPSYTTSKAKIYGPAGAACFYDVPPPWDDLTSTNPNGRRGYGIIVSRNDFWRVGGRPAIYDGDPDAPTWPEHERYRLVATDPNRSPSPLDWMHEREWRIRDGLSLNPKLTWWPCVPWDEEVRQVLDAFSPKVTQVYSLQSGAVFRAAVLRGFQRFERVDIGSSRWGPASLGTMPKPRPKRVPWTTTAFDF